MDLCQGFRPDLLCFYVPFVPGIPDQDISPIMAPGHCKKVEAAIFKQSHAVVFYRHLLIVVLCPFTQQPFGISISHDHYVQGLCGPIGRYGHLVEGNTGRRTLWHGLPAVLYHLLEILVQHEMFIVMLLRRGFRHSYQAHDRADRCGIVTSAVHHFAHIQDEILYGLF